MVRLSLQEIYRGGEINTYQYVSTDVLEDLRINVTEQVSGKVIWYKVDLCYLSCVSQSN